MEKDNDSKEESSDYSCSPVTKNELLTVAKYHAIKFAILFVLATSISLFLFICSKSLSRLLRVLHWKTKKISSLPSSHFPFQKISILLRLHPSFRSSRTFLHFIYYFPVGFSSCFFSYISPKTYSVIEYYKIIIIFVLHLYLHQFSLIINNCYCCWYSYCIIIMSY